MTAIDHRKLRHLNLLAEVRELIAKAESGQAEAYVYEQVALKIEAWMQANPELTQGDVAARIGKEQKYVSRLLQALRRARLGEEFRIDWGSGSNKRVDLERRVPSQHKDRVQMAKTLLADPKVAKTVAPTIIDPKTQAGRLISQAVYDHDHVHREKNRQAAQQRREDKAMPLPAYMANMVEKINEWSLGLAALVDDLDDLPEGRGRELVASAIDGLITQAERWAEKLEPGRPELTVIEGQATIAS